MRIGRWIAALLVMLSGGSLPAWTQEEKKAEAAPANPAVKAIQDAGGKVEIDEKAEGQPITQVSFATLPVGDDVLQHVKGLASLKKLTLNNTKVTDAGLDAVRELSGLEKLYLVDTGITDAGVEKLKGLGKLQVLSLVGTPVTDACLDHIKAMEGLKEVFLAGTKVTDDAVKALKESKQELKVDRVSEGAAAKPEEAKKEEKPEEKKEEAKKEDKPEEKKEEQKK